MWQISSLLLAFQDSLKTFTQLENEAVLAHCFFLYPLYLKENQNYKRQGWIYLCNSREIPAFRSPTKNEQAPNVLYI